MKPHLEITQDNLAAMEALAESSEEPIVMVDEIIARYMRSLGNQLIIAKAKTKSQKQIKVRMHGRSPKKV